MDIIYAKSKMSFVHNASWVAVFQKQEQILLVFKLKEELFVGREENLQTILRLQEKLKNVLKIVAYC